MVQNLSFVNSRDGFLAINNGLALKTTDGGVRWARVPDGQPE